MATIKNLVVRIGVDADTRGVRRIIRDLDKINRKANEANRATGRIGGALSGIGGASLSRLSSGLGAVRAGAMTAAKAVTAFALAAASMNTAIQGGVALAPLAGLLAAIPAAALGAGAAIGTLKLALSGMSDVMDALASGNQEKFDKALERMSPAARSVARELFALRPAFLSVRNAAQDALFGQLRGQATALARVLVGPLRQGVAAVATQFGAAGRRVAEFARQSATVDVIRRAFAAVAASLRQLVPAIQPVLAGFRALAGVGLGFLPGIAAGVSQVAQRFGAWLQQMAASGRAAQWISNALATLKQLGAVAANVGGIIKSVLSAASAGGSQFLGVIGAALAQLNAFLKTAQGQAALTSIFQTLGQIGTAVGPVIAALVTQLGTLAPPLAQLAQMIGPILTTAINALGPALAALAPGLQALFGGLGQAITAIAPAIGPLAQAIGQIGIVLGPILPLVGTLVSQLVQGLAPIVGRLVVALGPLVGAIVQLAAAFTPLIPPIAQIIVQLVQGLVPALTPIIGIAGQIVGVLGRFLVEALQMLMRALGPLLPVLSQVAQTIGTSLLQVLVALAPALLSVLEAVLPLVPSIAQLIPTLAQVLTAVTPLLVILIQLASVILDAVLPIVVKLATILVSILGGALKIVVAIVTGALKVIVAIFRWLFDVLVGHSIVPDLVNAILQWIGSLPGRVIGFFADLARGAVSQMKGLLSAVGSLARSILGVFGDAGRWLYNAGKAIITGLINGLWAKAQALFNAMGKIAGWVRGFWPFSPAKHGPLSGRGSMEIAGRNVTAMLARGMLAGQGVLGSAAARLATVAQGAAPALAAPVPAGPAGAIPVAAPRGVAAAAGTARPAQAASGPDAGMLARAVAQALHGVTVKMDGQPVGQIVSRHLGRATDQRRRTG